MPPNLKLNSKKKDLIRRYLIWCYKTTKEDLDRIDRYFTQNIADDFLLDQLTRSKDFKSKKSNANYRKLVRDFARYKIDKRKKKQINKNILMTSAKFCARNINIFKTDLQPLKKPSVIF